MSKYFSHPSGGPVWSRERGYHQPDPMPVFHPGHPQSLAVSEMAPGSSDPLPFDQWPTRVRNALRNEGILTWGALMSKTHGELWRIPGLGPLSLKQVLAFIAERKQATK